MRIAHISDIHFCSNFKRTNIGKTNRILKYALDRGFDHLVITGDVSDNSDLKDFVTLRRMLIKYDLLKSEKTSIVIGNHDIYGGAQRPIDVVDFPRRATATNYLKKLQDFKGYFKELFSDCYIPNNERVFPYAKIVKDTVFIGINSIDVYGRIKNAFAANGRVHDDDYISLDKIFSRKEYKDKQKCVLIHHHFYKDGMEATASVSMLLNKLENYTLKLRGKKRLFSLFRNYDIKLVLHGHSHEIRLYERKGIQFINAGSTIDNFSDDASVIFVDFENGEVNSKVETITNKIVKMPEGDPEIFNHRPILAQNS